MKILIEVSDCEIERLMEELGYEKEFAISEMIEYAECDVNWSEIVDNLINF